MVYYLDTSALVKRYVTETGSRWIAALCQPAANHVIATVLISKVEAAAAFAVKRRQNSLSIRQYNPLLETLEQDFTNEYHLLTVDPSLVNLAVELTRRHKLRGYDAVQLASAITFQNRLATVGLPVFQLITADADLLTAAQHEGLMVEDPNLHP